MSATVEEVIDVGFDAAHVLASTILARLPIALTARSAKSASTGFFPRDCLVMDEGTSPKLYHALASLLNGVPMYVVSPGITSIKPEPGHSTLGYVTAASLHSLDDMRSKAGGDTRKTEAPLQFSVMIFNVKKLSPIAPILASVVRDRLRSPGVVLVAADNAESPSEALGKLTIGGGRILPDAPLIRDLYPCEHGAIFALQRGE